MNDNNSENKKKQRIKLGENTKTFLLNIFATVVIIFFAFVIMNRLEDNEKEIIEQPNFSEVTKIGELATLKCFYHNVAEDEKQPDGLFKYGLFQYGYKKFWIEYTGTVEIGIDISKVKINPPTEDGIVQVYVPEVEIFRLNQDISSIQEPVYEKGVFTSITTEEKTKALSMAQEKMENTARSDQTMIRRARDNAKTLIEQYIINVGANIGQEYSVVWMDASEDINENDFQGGTKDVKEKTE